MRRKKKFLSGIQISNTCTNPVPRHIRSINLRNSTGKLWISTTPSSLQLTPAFSREFSPHQIEASEDNSGLISRLSGDYNNSRSTPIMAIEQMRLLHDNDSSRRLRTSHTYSCDGDPIANRKPYRTSESAKWSPPNRPSTSSHHEIFESTATCIIESYPFE